MSHESRPDLLMFGHIPPEGKDPEAAVHLSQASYHLRPLSQWTQDDQDHFDKEAWHQARENLIQSWKDRLSAISLIMTFFAAMEAQLLSATASSTGHPSALGDAANAGLMGALVIHSFAGAPGISDYILITW
ncbi:hypothetical protein BJ322DRAFT_1208046 [Thelephora terrestris]|uniref:Uncharacterized protein n=1 Tax=Thelephora terrestris TaxID=56493 RepID=A0A9P6HNT7_9AGAM|nr:hypothetical protein BJ322DRAFT_1208046 [Thelephora terrestris]